MKFGMREMLFVMLLGAIMGGAWWFVFRPQNQLHAEELAQIETKRAKLNALNRTRASLTSLREEIDEYNRAIEFFQAKLPSQQEIDRILEEVWQLAESSQLTTTSIRTLRRDQNTTLIGDEGPYAEQPIQLELEGDFTGLYAFLLELEQKARIIRVHTMNVEKDLNEGEGHMRATLTLSIFYERA